MEERRADWVIRFALVRDYQLIADIGSAEAVAFECQEAQLFSCIEPIDIEVCRRCGGKLRVIASIEEQATIERILEHLGHTPEAVDPANPSRAPPQADLLV
jgi:hypothetical protein